MGRESSGRQSHGAAGAQIRNGKTLLKTLIRLDPPYFVRAATRGASRPRAGLVSQPLNRIPQINDIAPPCDPGVAVAAAS
jgi:hypothetical protein